ncbi:MAG: hypothetical protein ABIA12_01930 [Candidatus Aenigmatarchaeota archaeon]
MSVEEIADYVSFRRAARNLYGLGKKSYFLDVESNMRYFDGVKIGIDALRIYQELANMKETETVLKDAVAGKGKGSIFAGKARDRLVAEIYENLPAILRKSDLVAVAKMPKRNPAAKESVVSIMRNFKYIKENVPSIPDGKSLIHDSRELLLGPHGTMYSELAGMLSGLKAVDPLAESEEHYNDAHDYLHPKKSYTMEEDIMKNLMPAIASMEALFGVLKPYHGISDSEISEPKDILRFKELLDAAYERIMELGEQLEQSAQIQQSVPVKIFPKNEDAFAELGHLQKKLMENVGSNSLSIDFKPTLNRSVRILEKTLLSSLDGDEGLDPDKKEFLKESWNLITALKGLKGDDQLDETRKELVKTYSFHLKEFLESK